MNFIIVGKKERKNQIVLMETKWPPQFALVLHQRCPLLVLKALTAASASASATAVASVVNISSSIYLFIIFRKDIYSPRRAARKLSSRAIIMGYHHHFLIPKMNY